MTTVIVEIPVKNANEGHRLADQISNWLDNANFPIPRGGTISVVDNGRKGGGREQDKLKEEGK